MQDINNCIKENDTDNRIIKNLNDLIDTILCNDDEYDDVVDEYTNGETIVECLDKLEDVLYDYTMDKIYSSGGGNSSSDEQKAIVINNMKNSAGNFYGCLERLNSMNRFTIFNNQQIQGSITTTLTNGKLQIGTVTNEGFEGVNIYLSGYAPCCYRVTNDNTEYRGLLQFTGKNIYLIPSKEFANETTYLTVYCGGSTLEFEEYPA